MAIGYERQLYILPFDAEKSGQDEFDFEYGEDFGSRIESFRPTSQEWVDIFEAARSSGGVADARGGRE